jgi:formate hydrogenlyase subunit 4
MDYQGIGMLALLALFVAIFIGVLVSRSKSSNSNASLVGPEVSDIKIE